MCTYVYICVFKLIHTSIHMYCQFCCCCCRNCGLWLFVVTVCYFYCTFGPLQAACLNVAITLLLFRFWCFSFNFTNYLWQTVCLSKMCDFTGTRTFVKSKTKTKTKTYRKSKCKCLPAALAK